MTRQGWGEYIVRYNDDTYQHHVPCWVDLDEMEATLPEAAENDYWVPDEPVSTDWDENWEEVEFEGETYPAVQDWDDDGQDYATSTYGEEKFITVRTSQ